MSFFSLYHEAFNKYLCYFSCEENQIFYSYLFFMNYLSILENSPIALGNVSLKGEILYVNPAFCQLIGYSNDELKDKTLELITHPDDRELSISEFKKIQEGEQKEYSIIKRYIHKDGSVKWAKLFVIPILNNSGNPESFIGFIQDITEQQDSNEKLKRQETVFRNMFMKNPQIMAIYNTDNLAILEVNEAASTILGYSREEMLNLTIPELVADEDLKTFNEYNRNVKDKFALQKEWKVNCKNKTQVILEMNSQPLIYQGVNARHIMANDITKRKKQEIAINEYAEFIRHSQEIVQMGNWEKDYISGKLIWSENLYHLLGLDPEKVEPSFEGFIESVHPDDQNEMRSAISQTMQTMQEVNIDCRITKSDKTIGWLSNTIRSRFENNRLVKLKGISIDITKRKKIELELDLLNEIEKIINNISFQFLNGKKSETSKIINQGLEGITTYLKIDRFYIFQIDTHGENLQNTHEWCNNNTPSKADNFKKLSLKDFPWLMDQLKKAKPITCRDLDQITDVLKKENEFFSASDTVSFLIIPMYFEEKLRGFAGFETVKEKKEWDKLSVSKLTQLTDLISSELVRREGEDQLIQAKEKAEESSKLKTAFLAVISHEFRTPLNSIIGFSDIIQNITDNNEIKEFSSYIEKSGYEMLELLEDLFDLSFAHGSNIKNVPGPTTCLDLYWRAKTGLEENLFKAGKENQIKLITINHSNTIDCPITIDSKKVLQILSILSKNAVKFTEEGEIEFTIKPQKEKNQIQFFIRDTGIGIDDDKKDIIFDHFRQIDDSMTRPFEGLGIGLSIAKQLINLLKGTIEAESKVGQGSSFTVTIPTEFTNHIPAAPDHQVEKVFDDLQFMEGKFILVVDDDNFTHEIMQLYFKNINVKIQVAHNGKEAFEIVEKSKPDLILMDLIMPVMDGFEATSQIKLRWPHLPIVAVTAHSMLRERQSALEAGCDEIITKPIYRKVLYNTLVRFLKN